MKYVILMLLCSFSLHANHAELQTKFIWSGNEVTLEKKVNETLTILQNSNKKIKDIKISCKFGGCLVLIIYENNNEEVK